MPCRLATAATGIAIASRILRCHIAELEVIGGVPRPILCDRMKAAVIGQDCRPPLHERQPPPRDQLPCLCKLMVFWLCFAKVRALFNYKSCYQKSHLARVQSPARFGSWWRVWKWSPSVGLKDNFKAFVQRCIRAHVRTPERQAVAANASA
jgi:hypothetical protein